MDKPTSIKLSTAVAKWVTTAWRPANIVEDEGLSEINWIVSNDCTWIESHHCIKDTQPVWWQKNKSNFFSYTPSPLFPAHFIYCLVYFVLLCFYPIAQGDVFVSLYISHVRLDTITLCDLLFWSEGSREWSLISTEVMENLAGQCAHLLPVELEFAISYDLSIFLKR